MNGLDCNGFGKVDTDIDRGDGGGEGVVDVERNVGPRGVDAADEGESFSKTGSVRSIG